MATGKPPWEADMHSNHLALIFKVGESDRNAVAFVASRLLAACAL